MEGHSCQGHKWSHSMRQGGAQSGKSRVPSTNKSLAAAMVVHVKIHYPGDETVQMCCVAAHPMDGLNEKEGTFLPTGW